VETWQHDMDGGWTRYLFDQYHIPYVVLRPENLASVNLQRDFDVLIFTDKLQIRFMQGKNEREGKPVPSNYPPEFAKGMEKKGFDNLMKFVNNGGRIMAWGPAVELFLGAIAIGEKEDENKEEFMLPVSDIGKNLATKGLYVPGSLLRVNFRTEHPLAWGMPEQCGVFHRGTPVFRTSIPGTRYGPARSGCLPRRRYSDERLRPKGRTAETGSSPGVGKKRKRTDCALLVQPAVQSFHTSYL
jgi:hypothetical protein